jgi:hypothetical protein
MVPNNPYPGVGEAVAAGARSSQYRSGLTQQFLARIYDNDSGPYSAAKQAMAEKGALQRTAMETASRSMDSVLNNRQRTGEVALNNAAQVANTAIQGDSMLERERQLYDWERKQAKAEGAGRVLGAGFRMAGEFLVGKPKFVEPPTLLDYSPGSGTA